MQARGDFINLLLACGPAGSAFVPRGKAATGQDATIPHSHGGLGQQVRAIVDGLGGSVVWGHHTPSERFGVLDAAAIRP